MPIIAKAKPKRDPIPEGLYPAICYGVYDIGTVYSTFYGNDSRKIIICWEIPELRVQIEREGKKVDLPQAISRQITLSLHKKAVLRKILEGWRGKRFTDEEAKSFDVSKLIGAACQIQVMHSEDGQYANVDQVLPKPAGFAGKAENAKQYFSFDDNMDIPENTPEWVESLIKASPEWKKRTNPPTDAELAGTPREPGEEEIDSIPF